MNYNIKVEPKEKSMTLGEIPDGSLAIVTGDSEFTGELFFKNVAGLHSISKNRYWESDYMADKRSYSRYTGPVGLSCRLIGKGDVLKIEEAK